jgi:hypothetical protein
MTHGSVPEAVLREAESKEGPSVQTALEGQKRASKSFIKELYQKHYIKRSRATTTAPESAKDSTMKTDSKKEMVRAKLGVLKATKTIMKKESKVDLDKKYQDKYPHYVKGSVGEVGECQKRTAKIECVDCGAHRQVYTSDLFQVKRCLGCLKTKKTGKESNQEYAKRNAKSARKTRIKKS